jgi:hypothetical protein
MHLEE